MTPVATAVSRLKSAMPVYAMKTLEGQLDETLMTDRLIAMLAAGFGLLATVLASIGLYGVISSLVVRRRNAVSVLLPGAMPLVLTSIQRRLDLLAINEYADLASRDSPDMLFNLMGFGVSPGSIG